jgi:surfeit locus 1 family protein
MRHPPAMAHPPVRAGFRVPDRASPKSPVLLALAAVIGVAASAYLGSWQLQRAAYKLELQQLQDLAQRQVPLKLPAELVAHDALAYRRVQAHGQFRPELTILLDNRVHAGVVGYEVITPLHVGPGDLHVLVNRGWVKAARTRQELPPLVTPRGPVRAEGIALPPSRRYVELSSQTVSGKVWQNLDLERFAQTYGIALQPLVLQQSNDVGDGLVRAWRRADTGVERHRAYALQWFAMSALIAVGYAVFLLRKRSFSAERSG